MCAKLAVLTNLGEKMSDEEVDELLKAVDTSSGEINYTGNKAPHDSSAIRGSFRLMHRFYRPCEDDSGELRRFPSLSLALFFPKTVPF